MIQYSFGGIGRYVLCYLTSDVGRKMLEICFVFTYRVFGSMMMRVQHSCSIRVDIYHSFSYISLRQLSIQIRQHAQPLMNFAELGRQNVCLISHLKNRILANYYFAQSRLGCPYPKNRPAKAENLDLRF